MATAGEAGTLAGHRTSVPNIESMAGSLQKRQRVFFSRTARVRVVGVSQYQDAIRLIAGLDKADERPLWEGLAILTPEPTNPHASLWAEKDGSRDLGVLAGQDASSVGINNAGQVIGTSGAMGLCGTRTPGCATSVGRSRLQSTPRAKWSA